MPRLARFLFLPGEFSRLAVSASAPSLYGNIRALRTFFSPIALTLFCSSLKLRFPHREEPLFLPSNFTFPPTPRSPGVAKLFESPRVFDPLPFMIPAQLLRVTYFVLNSRLFPMLVRVFQPFFEPLSSASAFRFFFLHFLSCFSIHCPIARVIVLRLPLHNIFEPRHCEDDEGSLFPPPRSPFLPTMEIKFRKVKESDCD